MSQKKLWVLTVASCAFFLSFGGISAKAGEEGVTAAPPTVKELSMTPPAQWDFQPGQGPRYLRDRLAQDAQNQPMRAAFETAETAVPPASVGVQESVKMRGGRPMPAVSQLGEAGSGIPYQPLSALSKTGGAPFIPPAMALKTQQPAAPAPAVEEEVAAAPPPPPPPPPPQVFSTRVRPPKPVPVWRDEEAVARKIQKERDYIPSEQPTTAATESGLEVGLNATQYHYHEKDLGMQLNGQEYGFNFAATGKLDDTWFLRATGRFFGGSLEYKGSGKSVTNPNYAGEIRATVGADLVAGWFGFSPYVGLGGRYLLSDLRGVTNTGAYGYKRYSTYLFLPIGFQPRVRFPNGDRLTLTAEFDPLIHGWQKSELSNIPSSIAYPDFMNRQKSGYGLYGDLLYQTGAWSFGPFVNYWNINESEVDCAEGSGTPIVYYGCGVEPHNHTVEAGMKLNYRFIGY